MGRSTSCFRIITCAGDSTDNDDLQAIENKGLSEKSRWSFRKRSARHRVLSNNVVTEAPYSVNKGSSDSANFQSPDPSTVLEKISVIHCTEEKAQLPTSLESKASETPVVTEDKSEEDVQPEESVVIVVQTAVRGFLAQKELLKLKNLVKLQAVVRGHLVRQHAIGALRCVQAIVKMQALVRARQSRLLRDGLSSEKTINEKNDKSYANNSGKEHSSAKPTYISINKLLSNKFARQLMESTPKERPVHIKCDLAKPNSAWNWLERWMSVSSVEPTPHPESKPEQVETEKNDDPVSLQEKTVVPSAVSNEIADSESNTKDDDVFPSVTDENSITYEKDDFEIQEPHSTSALAEDSLEKPHPEKVVFSDVEEPSTDLKSDVKPQTESTSLPHEEEDEGVQTDQPKRSMKRCASDSLETLENEGKKFGFGSRKVSNPSFLAAHAKFEELSSTAKSNRSLSSLNQDGVVEPKVETVSSGANTVTRTMELNGGSECGTELSVTSTLDSPDASEVGVAEPDNEQEVKSPEKETFTPNTTHDVVTKKTSSDQASDLPDSATIQPEKQDDVRDEFVNPIIAAESPLMGKPERSASNVSTPEASPRSHLTVPESQGTPSSQLSVSDKKKRSKSSSSQKLNSLSAAKRSPSNPNHDSGVRDSIEQSAKDQKNGKRRNSFGSTGADHTDQEPRKSCSGSSSVPRFMQVTESAKAKLQANSSPRSSPDVHDREYAKKRHSLPGANGRQGSPRIQRSLSQAQAGSKGNGSLVAREKKWLR